MTDYSVSVRVDYPPKRGVVKVAAKDTLTQVVTSAAKALSIDETELKRYRPSLVSFAKDVVEVKAGAPLAEAGAGLGSVVLFTAPADLRPERRRKKKEVCSLSLLLMCYSPCTRYPCSVLNRAVACAGDQGREGGPVEGLHDPERAAEAGRVQEGQGQEALARVHVRR
jgi:hypothetical protein